MRRPTWDQLEAWEAVTEDLRFGDYQPPGLEDFRAALGMIRHGKVTSGLTQKRFQIQLRIAHALTTGHLSAAQEWAPGMVAAIQLSNFK